MLVKVMFLLSLPGLLSGLQSPLLNQLWTQGKLRLSHPEMASLHLELSRIDELEVRLRAGDRHTAERLSLEVRDRFRDVLNRFQLTAPLPGTLEGTPAWNEVELEDEWTQGLWSRVRELPFSDEQLSQLIHQLRRYDVLERELVLTPSEEKVLEIEELRDTILSQLSRDTHDLVRQMSDNFNTFKHSHPDTASIQSEVAQLKELLGKQNELEEFSKSGRSLSDTFHQVVMHNAQKIHKLKQSLSDRREEL